MYLKNIVWSAALLGLSATASADLEPFTDYDASEEVYLVTTVKVDSNMEDAYLEGLRETWIPGQEAAKELGQIKDYGIYANQYGSSDDFDLVLVVELEGTDDIAPNRERYEKFLEAYGQANMDQANDTVLELYNKIRRIQGNYLLRKITVK